jgi:thioredoxin-related protein
MRLLILFLSLLLPSLSFAETITCAMPLNAYDTATPSKQIGVFDPGSKLEVSDTPRPDGMVEVSFKQPSGPEIKALCRPDDVKKSKKSDGMGEFGKTELFRSIKSSLIDSTGQALSAQRLSRFANCKFVLVYFSAHWCPPCRKFTPEFVEFYNKNIAQSTGSTVDAIFVSSDETAENQLNYMKETKMPWAAVRFDTLEASPLQQFAGNGIPCVALLNDKGEVIAHSYKGEDYKGPKYPLGILTTQMSIGTPDADGWLTDFGKAKELATQQKKLLLLSITTTAPQPACDAYNKEILHNAKFKEYAAKNLILAQADLNEASQTSELIKMQVQGLCGMYDIESYPVVIVHNSEGKELGRISYTHGGPEAFISALKKFSP